MADQRPIRGLKSPKAAPIGAEEVAIANTRLWPLQEFAPYNPDDLVGKKTLTVFDDMRTDDQVKACVELKKLTILGPGWQIVPGDDKRRAIKAADFVEHALDRIPGTFDEILYGMLTCLEYGFSVTERIAGIVDDGEWKDFNTIKALKDKAPYDLDFVSDKFGNLQKIKQTGRSDGDKEMSPDRFIVMVHQQRFGNWYGESDLRAAHKSWWVKTQIVKFWSMHLERFGLPTVLGRYPKGTSPADRVKWRLIIEKLQAATAMLVPEGLSLEFVETKQSGSDIFKSAVDRFDLGIAKALLVPNLLGLAGGEPETGSFARSKTSFEIYMFVVEGIRTKLQEAVNEQIVTPLWEWNFAPSVEKPRFEFLPLSEENKQAISKEWTAAVQAGAVTPSPDDENYQRSLLGFPERELPKPGDLPALPAPPEPPEDDDKIGEPVVIDVTNVPTDGKAAEVRRRLLAAFADSRHTAKSPVTITGLKP